MMEITVNGEVQQAEPGISLGGLVRTLGLDPRTMAALVNDAIVERDQFDEVCLEPGNAVELVRFVPGG